MTIYSIQTEDKMKPDHGINIKNDVIVIDSLNKVVVNNYIKNNEINIWVIPKKNFRIKSNPNQDV